MVKCDGKKECAHRGLKDECGNAWAVLQCEHSKVVEECDWGPNHEPPADLMRIADALEKIAKELEKMNKLKVAEIPTDNYDGIPLKIREIMEG